MIAVITMRSIVVAAAPPAPPPPPRLPCEVARMKQIFLVEATKNKVLPVGAGASMRAEPEPTQTKGN